MKFLSLSVTCLVLGHLVHRSTSQVMRNDPTFLACPQYSITSNSSIASPLYPEYAPNFYCEYNFQAPKDRYVLLKFDRFNFPPRSKARRGINYEKVYPRCVDDFVEISDDPKYSTRFRYCGDELQGKEISSQGRSVKLILQTKGRNVGVGGFQGSVSFPLRKKQGQNDVSCGASPDPRLLRCKAPLHRIMTPESSLQLNITKKGADKCSIVATLTKEYQEMVQFRQDPEHVINLNYMHDRCRIGMRYPLVHHLTEDNTLVYDVSSADRPNYEIMLKQFSVKQRRMCGGHVKLEPGKTFTISYNAMIWPKKQTCMWVIHGGEFDNSIKVNVHKFKIQGDNTNCQNHHLSMMYVGPNMFEMMKEEIAQDPNKFRRTCATASNLVYQRGNRDIYGPLTLMVLLSHSPNFLEFRADFTSSKNFQRSQG